MLLIVKWMFHRFSDVLGRARTSRFPADSHEVGLAFEESTSMKGVVQFEQMKVQMMRELMHQRACERLWLDHVVALRGTHPKHDKRRPCVRIVDAMQLAACVVGAHSAHLN